MNPKTPILYEVLAGSEGAGWQEGGPKGNVWRRSRRSNGSAQRQVRGSVPPAVHRFRARHQCSVAVAEGNDLTPLCATVSPRGNYTGVLQIVNPVLNLMKNLLTLTSFLNGLRGIAERAVNHANGGIAKQALPRREGL